MKKISLYIALIAFCGIGVSCDKNDKSYDGIAQVAFDYPDVPVASSPTAWRGTEASIHNTVVKIDTDQVFILPIHLIASGAMGEVNVGISKLDPYSVDTTQGKVPAISTIADNAISFSPTASIAAGRFIGEVPLSITYANLSGNENDNIIYLYLTGTNISQAENYRRIKLTFVKL